MPPGIKLCNSLTGNEYGIIDRGRRREAPKKLFVVDLEPPLFHALGPT
jgi:hypothetical protein